MKNFLYIFTIALLYTPIVLTTANATHTFDGVWQLNNADGYFGGELEIENCTDIKCDFKIQSWHDQHICDTDGQIILTSQTTGTYSSKSAMYDPKKDFEYSIPVGINFELLSNGELHLEYINPDSVGAFCGMSATVEGIWARQEH